MLSGSVKTNPGPDKLKKSKLSFAVWNLDSIPGHDYRIVLQVETLQDTYDFDLFGVCESRLNDKMLNEDIAVNVLVFF